MAVVILGGLLTSTLLHLFILPGLYLAFGQARRRQGAGGDQPAPEAVAAGIG
jgi:Cu/Ag efflux pump CusA